MPSLNRYLSAQQAVYRTVLQELRQGRKETHWMWFVFPQIQGLGGSPMAQRYAIHGLSEAQAYAQHPTLGPRLLECFAVLLSHRGRAIEEILGHIDALKLCSCATLFQAAWPTQTLFQEVLDAFYAGQPDVLTLKHLGDPLP